MKKEIIDKIIVDVCNEAGVTINQFFKDKSSVATTARYIVVETLIKMGCTYSEIAKHIKRTKQGVCYLHNEHKAITFS